MAALVLRFVLLHRLGDFRNGVFDHHGLTLKIDTIPLQAQQLAPAQAIKDGYLYQRIYRDITVTTDNGTVNTTTGQVSKLEINTANTTSVEDDIVFEYTYDANGNITQVVSGGKTTKYTYDKANQLIREDNQAANKTWIWTYDNAGNITSRTEYAYTDDASPTGGTTTSYTYGNVQWKDQLTKVGTNAITYDEIGNMLTYNGSTFTWEHGRELQKLTYNVGNDSNTANDLKWEFVYNATD